MHYKRVLLLTIAILVLSYRSHALKISSPRPHSVIVTGSTVNVTWVDANIESIDIQLKKYTDKADGSIIALLAADIKSNLNSHLVTIPTNLSTSQVEYIVVIAHHNIVLSSVGPLEFVLSARNSTPAISESSGTSSSITIEQPSSILVPPLLLTPIKRLDTIDNPNNTAVINTTDINVSNIDYGPTVTSAQVAVVSICIVVISSIIVCIYTMGRSFIIKRHVSRGSINKASSSDSIKQGSSPNINGKTPLDRKNGNVLEDINEEESYYDKMNYDRHSYIDIANILTPAPRHLSSSPTQRLSIDSNIFGSPSQSSEYIYADLPLPPHNAYGFRS